MKKTKKVDLSMPILIIVSVVIFGIVRQKIQKVQKKKAEISQPISAPSAEYTKMEIVKSIKAGERVFFDFNGPRGDRTILYKDLNQTPGGTIHLEYYPEGDIGIISREHSHQRKSSSTNTGVYITPNVDMELQVVLIKN